MTLHTSYTLDRDGCVVSVGGQWSAFGRENGAENDCVQMVLGRPVADFVAGVDTQSFLNAVVFWCRCHQHAFRTQYRCDSPEIAREFAMTVTPVAGGHVRFDHNLTRAWSIPQRAAEPAFGQLPPLPRCSVCCKRLYRDRWYDVADLPAALRSVKTEEYRVCEPCKRRTLQDLAQSAGGAETPIARPARRDDVPVGKLRANG